MTGSLDSLTLKNCLQTCIILSGIDAESLSNIQQKESEKQNSYNVICEFHCKPLYKSYVGKEK